MFDLQILIWCSNGSYHFALMGVWPSNLHSNHVTSVLMSHECHVILVSSSYTAAGWEVLVDVQCPVFVSGAIRSFLLPTNDLSGIIPSYIHTYIHVSYTLGANDFSLQKNFFFLPTAWCWYRRKRASSCFKMHWTEAAGHWCLRNRYDVMDVLYI